MGRESERGEVRRGSRRQEWGRGGRHTKHTEDGGAGVPEGARPGEKREESGENHERGGRGEVETERGKTIEEPGPDPQGRPSASRAALASTAPALASASASSLPGTPQCPRIQISSVGISLRRDASAVRVSLDIP